LGVQEWVLVNRRKVSNPVVQRYVAKAMHRASWDGNTLTTPWCAYWVNAKLEYNGVTGTVSGMARSFLRWGVAVEDDDWAVGDIIVFWRGRHNDGVTGHVGFIVRWDDSYVWVLGGNQGDKVTVQKFSWAKILGVRRHRSWTRSRTARAGVGAGVNEALISPAVDNIIPNPPRGGVHALADAASEVQGPLQQLAHWKPWIMGLLTCITVGLVLYAVYCRWEDHKKGKNT
jgi:uncharacterized protein (TIGR02594 family)